MYCGFTQRAARPARSGRASASAGARWRTAPPAPVRQFAEADGAAVHRELKRPGVTLAPLCDEYRGHHPEGYGCSAFCEQCRRWVGRLSPVSHQRCASGATASVMPRASGCASTIPANRPTAPRPDGDCRRRGLLREGAEKYVLMSGCDFPGTTNYPAGAGWVNDGACAVAGDGGPNRWLSCSHPRVGYRLTLSDAGLPLSKNGCLSQRTSRVP
ncbi:hypothetical protein C8J28_12524 [Cereibacter azotoformans]|uniref:Uncharacterized protein n=1 Tax=Cereibacter azotoformans TaxID=43057 RepID=A0A2T5JST5_9RHOB|nr:hypothetical protein C8J28_12524 [Cereibacter azotoformans]